MTLPLESVSHSWSHTLVSIPVIVRVQTGFNMESPRHFTCHPGVRRDDEAFVGSGYAGLGSFAPLFVLVAATGEGYVG